VPAAAVLIADGRICAGRIKITLDGQAFAQATGLAKADMDPALLTIDAPFTTRRRGVEIKVIAGDQCPAPDATLIRDLLQAHL
jgi:hypothetical protein